MHAQLYRVKIILQLTEELEYLKLVLAFRQTCSIVIIHLGSIVITGKQ